MVVISLISHCITFSGDDHSEEDVEIRDPDPNILNNGKVDSTSVCAGIEV